MWRYYELLTDVTVPEIEQMKRGSHPMESKKALAARIVKDFHDATAAAKAAEDWAKQFQKDEVPEALETVSVAAAEVAGNDGSVRLDKLIPKAGLAASTSEASRKIKEKAVRVNGDVAADFEYRVPDNKELTIRVGRKVKRVVLT